MSLNRGLWPMRRISARANRTVYAFSRSSSAFASSDGVIASCSSRKR
jgi:hypothetical protein